MNARHKSFRNRRRVQKFAWFGPDTASLLQCFWSPHDLHDYAAPAPGLQIYWGMWTLMWLKHPADDDGWGRAVIFFVAILQCHGPTPALEPEKRSMQKFTEPNNHYLLEHQTQQTWDCCIVLVGRFEQIWRPALFRICDTDEIKLDAYRGLIITHNNTIQWVSCICAEFCLLCLRVLNRIIYRLKLMVSPENMTIFWSMQKHLVEQW